MFKKLFSKRPPAARQPAGFDPVQIAVAGLLVEAARADQRYDEREKAIVMRSLAKRFGFSGDEAATLCAEAERIQEDAVDVYRFTRHAKSMPHEDKLALIETLWEVVLSDGERDAYEDALIRQICGLIYISGPESAAARSRAEARLAAP